MIRLIITATFVVLYLIVSIPVAFVEWLIGKKWPDVKDRSCLAYVNWAFRVVAFCSGVKVTVIGHDRIPKDTAVLYVGNHRSIFDTVVTYPLVVGLTGFVSKIELLKVPLLRTWMKNLHCIFLDRKDIKAGLQTILQGIELMKSGISLIIFPEGTRSKKEGEFLPFHAGSFKLAEKSGCPIVPISINNTGAVLEDHFPWIKKTHVIVEYGEPIYVKDLDREAKKNLPDNVRQIIIDTYTKNAPLV